MGNIISECIKINYDEKSHVEEPKSPKMVEFRFQAPIKTRSVSPNKFDNIDLG